MKIEHVQCPSLFSDLRISVSEGHFQCVHMIRFSEPTNIGSLKTDRVNGPLSFAFIKMRMSGEKVLFLLVVSYTSIQGLQNLVFPYSL